MGWVPVASRIRIGMSTAEVVLALVGQPTLRRTTRPSSWRPRTAHRLRYTMPGTTSTETTDYAAHRLKIAGHPDQLLTE